MPSNYQPDANRTKELALCLSGGGYRATLFHLGALRRLNQAGVLSKLTTISSVSGGSITNGLLAKWWPALKAKGFANFDEFENELKDFCARDIRTSPLISDRLDPRNWPTLISDDHSATDFLAQEYEDHLVTGIKLGDLAQPGFPRFVFCASNLQTGASFEQSADRIGDYQIGHATIPEYRLSDAIAASSAFPIAFPPMVLKGPPGRFTDGKVPPGDLHRQLARRILLTDGGVYDNRGLEPVWKRHRWVLCSDGGKPFHMKDDPGETITRLLRSQDLIANQALALRKRWLIVIRDRCLQGVLLGSRNRNRRLSQPRQ